MTYETIGDSFKAHLDIEPTDYHYTLLAGNTIWQISRTYVSQPTFNWGHRVAIAGGYVIGFDLTKNEWGEKKTNADPEPNNHRSLSLFIMAESTIPGITYLINDRTWMIYRLTIIDDSADIEFVSDLIYKCYDRDLGKPMLTFYKNGKLYISYGMYGCGFMCEQDRFFVFDEENKKTERVSTTGAPDFSSTGATLSGVTFRGDWIHAGGHLRIGDCDSAFNPLVFAGTVKDSELKWTNLNRDLPEEGNDVIDPRTNNIYVVGDKVYVASLYK